MKDFEETMAKYLDLRHQIARINERAKVEVAKRRKEMAGIEAEITEAAQAAGLTTIPTSLGTGYWVTHYSCTVSSPDEFRTFVRENEAWELTDTRANKTGVKAYIEANGGELPPGVKFSSYRAFNVREDHSDKS